MQEQVLPCVAETDLSILECIFINTLIPTARGAEGTRPYCETPTKEEHICPSQPCFVELLDFDWIEAFPQIPPQLAGFVWNVWAFCPYSQYCCRIIRSQLDNVLWCSIVINEECNCLPRFRAGIWMGCATIGSSQGSMILKNSTSKTAYGSDLCDSRTSAHSYKNDLCLNLTPRCDPYSHWTSSRVKKRKTAHVVSFQDDKKTSALSQVCEGKWKENQMQETVAWTESMRSDMRLLRLGVRGTPQRERERQR